SCLKSVSQDPAPVTVNHLSSEPDMTKMIGATHGSGSLTTASMVESPVVFAGKPPVVTLAVTTLTSPFPCPFPFLSSLRQLTSARNCASSLVPRILGGTSGSLAKTTPVTLRCRCPSVVNDPLTLATSQGSSSPLTPRMAV